MGQQAATYLTLGLFAAAGLIAVPVLQRFGRGGGVPSSPNDVQSSLWLIVAVEAVVCVVAWVVSYLISLRIYQAKDL